MIRRTLLRGACLLGALISTGCASRAAPAATAATAAPTSADSLRAAVEWSKQRPGHVTVRVDRPAYVALFEILPGEGVSLVYPLPGDGARLPGGEIHLRADEWVTRRGRYLAQAAHQSWALPRWERPAGHLFLVASTEPLGLAPFAGTATRPGLARDVLGRVSTSRRPREVMVAIARRVLPAGLPPASRATAAVTPRDVPWRPLDAAELP